MVGWLVGWLVVSSTLIVRMRCDRFDAQAAQIFTECLELLGGAGEKRHAELSGRAQKVTIARRNYILQMLSAIYGRAGAHRFCEALLDPKRWGDLKSAFC